MSPRRLTLSLSLLIAVEVLFSEKLKESHGK